MPCVAWGNLWGKSMNDEDCKCSDCILKTLLVILAVLGVLVLVFFICQMMREVLSFSKDSPSYFNTLLSGIIGAGISAGLVYAGLRDGNKSKQIENQLKLRELFAEERRWEVHRTIQSEFKDTSYWYNLECKNKNLPCNYKIYYAQSTCDFCKTTAFSYYFLPALFDYLGLFEVAYMMLKTGQLSKSDFITSYKYRIENVEKYVWPMINGIERDYWKTFRKLVEEVSD